MFFRPSDEFVHGAVSALHETPYLIHVASTGATGRLQQYLWAVPGASSTLVGLEFLYERSQSLAHMGTEPDSFCSMQAARYLASASYEKALTVVEESPDNANLAMGVGMTAAVDTNRERRGKNQVFIAVRTKDGFLTLHAELPKGETSRGEQGEVCDLLTLNTILRAASVPCMEWSAMGVTYDLGEDSSINVTQQSTPLIDSLDDEMLYGNVMVWPDGSIRTSLDTSNLGLYRGHHIIFPGSFNPLHSGHRSMAALVETMTGKQVVYQMTGTHPDKGRVPLEELCARADQCQFRSPVLLMEDGALYVEKAKLLPGYAFLIGVDAVKGLLNPKYYTGGAEGVAEVLSTLHDLETCFYVVGRKIGRQFVTLEDVLAEDGCPPRYEKLFVPVSGRWDMSSTALRNK